MACLVVLLGLAVPASAQALATPAFRDGMGLHVSAVKQLSPRLFALTLTTDLLTAPTTVRVLLPAAYDRRPRQRFPVLWLFHGTSGGAADWTTQGDAERTTAPYDLITVMPDAGVDSDGGGWFTDWVNGGRFGPPRWETFHVEHLMPWIDAQLRTVRGRSGRAIAGLSQGGFGAMSYAARHPDRFVAAASFSGAVDIAANAAIAVPLVAPVILATEVALDRVPPNTFFGDRLTNELNYAAHDPATLAGNLRGTSLYTYTGDGNPGPLDRSVDLAAQAIEAGVHQLTLLFAQELRRRSIPLELQDYGPGTHAWPYWARDLRALIGPLMRDLRADDAAPARIDFQSADAHWTQWGWTVDVDRPAREFSALQAAGPTGFSMVGSGRARVRTPPRYRPGARATLTLDGVAVRERRTLRVGRDGALSIDVPLGPGNPAQQFTAGATTTLHTTRVTIRAPMRPGVDDARHLRSRGS